MWRACKAPSRVQWYSKLHPLAFSVCFFAVWRACRAALSYSVLAKSAPSRAQCVSFRFPPCRPHTRARVSEKQKKASPKDACASMSVAFLRWREARCAPSVVYTCTCGDTNTYHLKNSVPCRAQNDHKALRDGKQNYRRNIFPSLTFP